MPMGRFDWCLIRDKDDDETNQKESCLIYQLQKIEFYCCTNLHYCLVQEYTWRGYSFRLESSSRWYSLSKRMTELISCHLLNLLFTQFFSHPVVVCITFYNLFLLTICTGCDRTLIALEFFNGLSWMESGSTFLSFALLTSFVNLGWLLQNFSLSNLNQLFSSVPSIA